jgi:hypothetical protein
LSRGDVCVDQDDASGFRLGHEGQRAAITLAHDNDNLTLAGLMLSKATVDAVGKEHRMFRKAGAGGYSSSVRAGARLL